MPHYTKNKAWIAADIRQVAINASDAFRDAAHLINHGYTQQRNRILRLADFEQDEEKRRSLYAMAELIHPPIDNAYCTSPASLGHAMGTLASLERQIDKMIAEAE